MNAPALRVDRVSKRFGGVAAVQGVSLDLHRGEILSVVGPNGAGKTTLLNVIAGVHFPDSGSVRLGERELIRLTPDAIARSGVARTFQHPRLFASMNVLENCMTGAFRHARCSIAEGLFALPASRRADRLAETTARGCLEHVGLSALIAVPAEVLTTGQQRLLEVARALASKPTVLLLDEPAAGLDEVETAALGIAIRSMRTEGYGVLLVEHDMSLVMAISDRVFVMNEGLPVMTGTPGEVRDDPRVIACYLGSSGSRS